MTWQNRAEILDIGGVLDRFDSIIFIIPIIYIFARLTFGIT
jgi:CDP-diglyceride synthetase